MGTCHMGTLEKNVNKRVNCAMIFFARSSGRVTTHHATFPMRQEGILVSLICHLPLFIKSLMVATKGLLI